MAAAAAAVTTTQHQPSSSSAAAAAAAAAQQHRHKAKTTATAAAQPAPLKNKKYSNEHEKQHHRLKMSTKVTYQTYDFTQHLESALAALEHDYRLYNRAYATTKQNKPTHDLVDKHKKKRILPPLFKAIYKAPQHVALLQTILDYLRQWVVVVNIGDKINKEQLLKEQEQENDSNITCAMTIHGMTSNVAPAAASTPKATSRSVEEGGDKAAAAPADTDTAATVAMQAQASDMQNRDQLHGEENGAMVLERRGKVVAAERKINPPQLHNRDIDKEATKLIETLNAVGRQYALFLLWLRSDAVASSGIEQSQQVLHDNHFFEALYAYAPRALTPAFQIDTWAEVAVELERLFRSRSFLSSSAQMLADTVKSERLPGVPRHDDPYGHMAVPAYTLFFPFQYTRRQKRVSMQEALSRRSPALALLFPDSKVLHNRNLRYCVGTDGEYERVHDKLSPLERALQHTVDVTELARRNDHTRLGANTRHPETGVIKCSTCLQVHPRAYYCLKKEKMGGAFRAYQFARNKRLEGLSSVALRLAIDNGMKGVGEFTSAQDMLKRRERPFPPRDFMKHCSGVITKEKYVERQRKKRHKKKKGGSD